MWPRTDRHTDARDHNTFRAVYDSRKMYPGIERVQALTDIANPPNNAQLGSTPYQVTSGSVQCCGNAAIDRQTTDRQTDRHTHTHTHTQTAVISIHFALSTTHV